MTFERYVCWKPEDLGWIAEIDVAGVQHLASGDDSLFLATHQPTKVKETTNSKNYHTIYQCEGDFSDVSTDQKKYWWVVILIILVSFFVYTQTIKSPGRKKNRRL